MHWSFRFTVELPDIIATLEDCEWFREWYGRKGEDYRAKLVEAYNDALLDAADTAVAFEPVMQAEPVPYDKTPDLDPTYRMKLNAFRTKIGSVGSDEKDRTHKALAYVINKGRSILDIGCGLEKSVAASMYAVTNATRTTPVWLVCDTHKACRATLDRLALMEVPENDVAYIPGFGEKTCNQWFGLSDEAKSLPYHKTKSPCLKCQDAPKCDFAKRLHHFYMMLHRPIVVMTHSMFIRHFQPWCNVKDDHRLTDDITVIIDEQLKKWESGEFERAQIEKALFNAEEDYRKILNDLDKATAATGELPSKNGIVTGVGMMLYGQGIRSLIRVGWRLHAKSFEIPPNAPANYVPTPKNLSDDEITESKTICALLFASSTRYVIRSGDKYSILASRNLWDFPPRTVVLDGSARYTQVRWDDFKMWAGGNASVRGLNIHIMKGNPTKKSVSTPEKFEHFLDYARKVVAENKCTRTMTALNHDPGLFDLASVPAESIAYRNTDTRGSNAYADYDSAILLMSLFTNLTDYALRAALACEIPIPASDIWQHGKDGAQPRIDKAGFVDRKLALSFVRQAIDEVYQACMRVGVRRYDKGEYHVVCRLPNRMSVDELQGRLPDVKIHLEGFSLLGGRSLERGNKAVEKRVSTAAAKVVMCATAMRLQRILALRN